MKAYRVWEGLMGVKGSGKRKTFRFIGEDIGYWSDTHPTTSDRGIAYRVFHTENGSIIIHRIRWSKWSTEYDKGSIFQFANLDEAVKAGFGTILKNARVI